MNTKSFYNFDNAVNFFKNVNNGKKTPEKGKKESK